MSATIVRTLTGIQRHVQQRLADFFVLRRWCRVRNLSDRNSHSPTSTRSSTATETHASSLTSTVASTQTSSQTSTLTATGVSSQSTTLLSTESSTLSSTPSTTASDSATGTVSSTATSSATTLLVGKVECIPDPARAQGYCSVAGRHNCALHVDALNAAAQLPACAARFGSTMLAFECFDQGSEKYRIVLSSTTYSTFKDCTTVTAPVFARMLHELTQFPIADPTFRGVDFDLSCSLTRGQHSADFDISGDPSDASFVTTLEAFEQAYNALLDRVVNNTFFGCEATSPSTTVPSTASSSASSTVRTTKTTTGTSTATTSLSSSATSSATSTSSSTGSTTISSTVTETQTLSASSSFTTSAASTLTLTASSSLTASAVTTRTSSASRSASSTQTTSASASASSTLTSSATSSHTSSATTSVTITATSTVSSTVTTSASTGVYGRLVCPTGWSIFTSDIDSFSLVYCYVPGKSNCERNVATINAMFASESCSSKYHTAPFMCVEDVVAASSNIKEQRYFISASADTCAASARALAHVASEVTKFPLQNFSLGCGDATGKTSYATRGVPLFLKDAQELVSRAALREHARRFETAWNTLVDLYTGGLFQDCERTSPSTTASTTASSTRTTSGTWSALSSATSSMTSSASFSVASSASTTDTTTASLTQTLTASTSGTTTLSSSATTSPMTSYSSSAGSTLSSSATTTPSSTVSGTETTSRSATGTSSRTSTVSSSFQSSATSSGTSTASTTLSKTFSDSLSSTMTTSAASSASSTMTDSETWSVTSTPSISQSKSLTSSVTRTASFSATSSESTTPSSSFTTTAITTPQSTGSTSASTTASSTPTSSAVTTQSSTRTSTWTTTPSSSGTSSESSSATNSQTTSASSSATKTDTSTISTTVSSTASATASNSETSTWTTSASSTLAMSKTTTWTSTGPSTPTTTPSSTVSSLVVGRFECSTHGGLSPVTECYVKGRANCLQHITALNALFLHPTCQQTQPLSGFAPLGCIARDALYGESDLWYFQVDGGADLPHAEGGTNPVFKTIELRYSGSGELSGSSSSGFSEYGSANPRALGTVANCSSMSAALRQIVWNLDPFPSRPIQVGCMPYKSAIPNVVYLPFTNVHHAGHFARAVNQLVAMYASETHHGCTISSRTTTASTTESASQMSTQTYTMRSTLTTTARSLPSTTISTSLSWSATTTAISTVTATTDTALVATTKTTTTSAPRAPVQQQLIFHLVSTAPLHCLSSSTQLALKRMLVQYLVGAGQFQPTDIGQMTLSAPTTDTLTACTTKDGLGGAEPANVVHDSIAETSVLIGTDFAVTGFRRRAGFQVFAAVLFDSMIADERIADAITALSNEETLAGLGMEDNKVKLNVEQIHLGVPVATTAPLCSSGWVWNAINSSCVDLNECTAGTLAGLVCAATATCVNSPGTFMCECGAGYYGSGRVCHDIDECSMITLQDCSGRTFTDAQCAAIGGGTVYGCQGLLESWRSDGVCDSKKPSFACAELGCDGVDCGGTCRKSTKAYIVNSSIHACESETDCVNTEGGFQCTRLSANSHRSSKRKQTPTTGTFVVLLLALGIVAICSALAIVVRSRQRKTVDVGESIASVSTERALLHRRYSSNSTLHRSSTLVMIGDHRGLPLDAVPLHTPHTRSNFNVSRYLSASNATRSTQTNASKSASASSMSSTDHDTPDAHSIAPSRSLSAAINSTRPPFSFRNPRFPQFPAQVPESSVYAPTKFAMDFPPVAQTRAVAFVTHPKLQRKL